MKVHTLKCWPREFMAIKDGLKTYEWRKDDRGFHVGDLLELWEFIPKYSRMSGMALRAGVTWITAGPEFGVPEGFVVMGLQFLETFDGTAWARWERVG
jgi:ParB family chromosome partitioning protein